MWVLQNKGNLPSWLLFVSRQILLKKYCLGQQKFCGLCRGIIKFSNLECNRWHLIALTAHLKCFVRQLLASIPQTRVMDRAEKFEIWKGTCCSLGMKLYDHGTFSFSVFSLLNCIIIFSSLSSWVYGHGWYVINRYHHASGPPDWYWQELFFFVTCRHKELFSLLNCNGSCANRTIEY